MESESAENSVETEESGEDQISKKKKEAADGPQKNNLQNISPLLRWWQVDVLFQ